MGGYHTRLACMQVAKQTGTVITRKVVVYNHLQPKQMRALALRHNLDNENRLKLTFAEKLLFLRKDLKIRNLETWDKQSRNELSGTLQLIM